MSKNDITEICDLFEDRLSKRGFKPTRHLWNHMIDLCCKNSRLHIAVRYFQEMRKHDIPPDRYTFTALINGHGRSGNLYEALKYFNLMPEMGVLPNMQTYSAVLTLLRRTENLADAEAVFKSIKDRGLIPNTICYNIMLQVRGRDFPLCVRTWNEMLHSNLRSDAFTFGALIRSALLAGDKTAAKRFLERMKSLCLVPHESTYNWLIQTADSLPEARQYVDEMRSRRLLVRSTYVSLLMLIRRLNLVPSHGRQLYEELLAGNVPPDATLLGSFVRAALDVDDSALTAYLFSEAEKRRLCKADLYSMVVHDDMPLRALHQCLEHMRRHQVRADARLLWRVLHALRHQRLAAAAEGVLQLLQDLGASPTRTHYRVLAALFADAGDTQREQRYIRLFTSAAADEFDGARRKDETHE